MPRQTPLQRWCVIATLALLAGLLLHFAVPQIVFRIARHAELGREEAERIRAAETDQRRAETQAATLLRLSREVGRSVIRVVDPQTAGDDAVESPAPLGFGVIVDRRALAVTPFSVIDGLLEIQVTLSGRSRPVAAKLVATDLLSDLAVLEFQPPESCQIAVRPITTLPPFPGEFVLTLADFRDPRDSLQMGQVVGRGRTNGRICLHEADFIGTDAATALNIGSPLLNLRGEILGVCSAENPENDQERGCVVPASVADHVVSDLLRLGRVRRGWIGAFLHADILPGGTPGGLAAATRVAHVDYVCPGSPADKAGLRAGDDIMLMTQHLPVQTIGDLQRLVLSTVPPAELRFSVVRNGEFQVVAIPVETQPLLAPSLPGEREWEFQICCPHDPVPFDADEPLRGVIFRSVGPRLQGAGVRPGDAIVGINRIPTPNLERYCREVSAILSSRMVPRMEVWCRGESQRREIELPVLVSQ